MGTVLRVSLFNQGEKKFAALFLQGEQRGKTRVFLSRKSLPPGENIPLDRSQRKTGIAGATGKKRLKSRRKKREKTGVQREKGVFFRKRTENLYREKKKEYWPKALVRRVVNAIHGEGSWLLQALSGGKEKKFLSATLNEKKKSLNRIRVRRLEKKKEEEIHRFLRRKRRGAEYHLFNGKRGCD